MNENQSSDQNSESSNAENIVMKEKKDCNYNFNSYILMTLI